MLSPPASRRSSLCWTALERGRHRGPDEEPTRHELPHRRRFRQEGHAARAGRRGARGDRCRVPLSAGGAPTRGPSPGVESSPRSRWPMRARWPSARWWWRGLPTAPRSTPTPSRPSTGRRSPAARTWRGLSSPKHGSARRAVAGTVPGAHDPSPTHSLSQDSAILSKPDRDLRLRAIPGSVCIRGHFHFDQTHVRLGSLPIRVFRFGRVPQTLESLSCTARAVICQLGTTRPQHLLKFSRIFLHLDVRLNLTL